MPNKEAEKLLCKVGATSTNANHFVNKLIEGGFIEDIPITEAERFAQGARDWIGCASYTTPKDVFRLAKGWNTVGWEQVMKEKLGTPQSRGHVFDAMVILAKEAGEL